MNSSNRITGVLSPVVTPFKADLSPDAAKLVSICKWLISQDVGLAVFGTNSEANSLSVGEKITLMNALAEAGIPGQRMMPGTGCCALTDTVELTRHAMKIGAGGVLMLPPFYYKGVSDDGLFASYSEVIQRVGDARLKIYVYHIPQVSNVPITLSLIERLITEYPGTIAGVKDSSGDWNNTKAMLEQFQPRGFDVFAGSESFLLATMRAGGVGSITAMGNANPGPIARLAREWQNSDADAQQEKLNLVRNTYSKFPVIPALKAVIAHYSGDAEWATVRPPLVKLTGEQSKSLVQMLDAIGFTMPGLK
ncbi:dihydrodipicolinate synthase family protein [Lacisediminimonas sp.]|uniref:dihydrodipicolinate synthase family protein n=1 Tax=Lacisediminimonas sp. TaxID=3060582 RepID=UPI00271E83F6|nr:dihydrodipicolinate synthase family protein [Lacisediminimonas sp.]MDO8298840.1 dihydrodipicolinate synthase family protein [Lacisediminimonas sp.]